jgi:hypothetical protein
MADEVRAERLSSFCQVKKKVQPQGGSRGCVLPSKRNPTSFKVLKVSNEEISASNWMSIFHEALDQDSKLSGRAIMRDISSSIMWF